MTKNIAIVTGASSGMGREFVLQIAAKYGKLDEIWAIARREELLWQLQGEAALPVRILTMDLAQEESIKRLMALLATENPRIRILVNSAGCGRIGNFFGSSYEGVLSMINVNCKALTAVTYACLPCPWAVGSLCWLPLQLLRPSRDSRCMQPARRMCSAFPGHFGWNVWSRGSR